MSDDMYELKIKSLMDGEIFDIAIELKRIGWTRDLEKRACGAEICVQAGEYIERLRLQLFEAEAEIDGLEWKLNPKTKLCAYCGVEFRKKRNVSKTNWTKTRFCSRRCFGFYYRNEGPSIEEMRAAGV